MTKSSLSILLAAALLAVFAGFTGPAAVQDPDKDEDTQLATYMKEINKTLRKMRTALKDADRTEESIGMVRRLEELALHAKLETPAKLGEMSDGESAQMLVAFQKQVCEMLGVFVQLELSLLDGDLEAAAALRKEANDLKSPAHKLFKIKD